MKKFFGIVQPGLIMTILALMTSCVSSQSFMPVKGIGAAIDKNYSVSDFHGIDVSGGFDVVLSQGGGEGLTLTAQENLFEYIHVEVVQGILKIYTEGNVMPTKSLKAHIAFKLIDEIEISGGGDIVSETPLNVTELAIAVSGGGDLTSVINTRELRCHVSGGGDVKIDGAIQSYNLNLTGGGDIRSAIEAVQVNCEVSGGGDVTLTNKQKANDANISISGGGDLTMGIQADKLGCKVSGGGSATLTGQAAVLEISVSGGGDVMATGLLTQTALFHANGGSDIHIHASEKLSGDISGGGDVYYSGNPAQVSVDTRGGSEIHRQ